MAKGKNSGVGQWPTRRSAIEPLPAERTHAAGWWPGVDRLAEGQPRPDRQRASKARWRRAKTQESVNGLPAGRPLNHFPRNEHMLRAGGQVSIGSPKASHALTVNERRRPDGEGQKLRSRSMAYPQVGH